MKKNHNYDVSGRASNSALDYACLKCNYVISSLLLEFLTINVAIIL